MRAARFAAAQTAALLGAELGALCAPRGALRGALCALLALSFARAAAALPAPGACPTSAGRGDAAALLDATAALVREGDALEHRDLPRVRSLLPPEVWGQRRVFFSAGMRMEIGACHRRYSAPGYFADASARFASAVRLDAANNLLDYRAGLPFPPEAIARDDPAAAAKWAWNLEYRHRGAGPRGRFRISDMPSRLGETQTYTGEFFQLRTSHRADLAESAFALPGSHEQIWIGGGRFDSPLDARHLGWRQLRPLAANRDHAAPDLTFVYAPAMRKLRRSATAWVDGMFTPSFRASPAAGGGALAAGGNALAPTRALSPGATLAATASEHLQTGFSDLSLRPNAYRWRLLGERELLAPINGRNPGYPQNAARSFGSSGLSLGSDRWDVRYAVVVEGTPLRGEQGFEALTLYIDTQTQLPLYLITRLGAGRIAEIAIPVHRFSGDVADYHDGPGGERALVFDPVAVAVYRAAGGGSGWRREAYDVRSTPPSQAELREMTSTDSLLRGR